MRELGTSSPTVFWSSRGRGNRRNTPRLITALSAVLLVSYVLPTSATIVSTSHVPAVEEAVDAFVAPFAAVIGGPAYAGESSGACARARSDAPYYPMTYSLAAQLYGSIGNATLDPLHGCYLNNESQCVAWLGSTAANCEGRLEDSLASGATEAGRVPVSGHAYTTSAAALAALVGTNASTGRLRLSRSLQRSREIGSALDTLAKQYKDGIEKMKNLDEANAIAFQLSIMAAGLVRSHHTVVMEKYDVLAAWIEPTLGAGGDVSHLNAMVRTEAAPCIVVGLMPQLLRIDHANVIVALLMEQLAMQGDVAARDRTLFPDPERGMLCMQALYVVGAMAIEDARIRGLYRMLTNETLSADLMWPAGVWTDYVPANTTEMIRRFSLAWELTVQGAATGGLFGVTTPPGIINDLEECSRRAVLRAAYPDSGLVPPSVTWCHNRTSAGGRQNVAVPGGSFTTGGAMRNGVGCPLGWGVWDGDCGGSGKPRICSQCPAGATRSKNGLCVCAFETEYVTPDGGCIKRGAVSDAPSFSLAPSIVNVVPVAPDQTDDAADSDHTTDQTARDSQPLRQLTVATAALSPSTVLADTSAYLTVDITCESGLTTFVATPSGRRTAPCGASVQYQRQATRTGMARSPGPGKTLTFVTYANSLQIDVASTGAVGGDRCRLSSKVLSGVRISSNESDSYQLTFRPSAALVTLAVMNWTAIGIPPCTDVVNGVAGAPKGELFVGMCSPANDPDTPVLFMDARRYRVMGDWMMGDLLASAAAGNSAPQLQANAASLVGRVGIRVALVDAVGDALGEAQWIPQSRDTVGGVWQPVLLLPVGMDVLLRMAGVQVDVRDAFGGVALGTRTGWVAYYFNPDELPRPPGPDPTSDSSSDAVGSSHTSVESGGNGGGGGDGSNGGSLGGGGDSSISLIVVPEGARKADGGEIAALLLLLLVVLGCGVFLFVLGRELGFGRARALAKAEAQSAALAQSLRAATASAPPPSLAQSGVDAQFRQFAAAMMSSGAFSSAPNASGGGHFSRTQK